MLKKQNSYNMDIIFEKKYWSVGEFTTLSGEPYEGYVGIYNNDGYIYDTQEKLEKNTTYYTQFNTGKYFFDRILDEQLELPYTKKEIQFHANDFLYKGSIKTILQRLQQNNDFLYRCATLSDTLIPAVDDCSILATQNDSYYIFKGINGGEYKEIPNITNEGQNVILKDVKKAFVVNPAWDFTNEELEANRKADSSQFEYPLKRGDKPKQSYPAKWYKIPNTAYKLQLGNGYLKRYNLSSQKQTKTALDPTFYPQTLENGTVTEPLYNFHDIVSSEIVVTDVGMQEILVTSEGISPRYTGVAPKEGEEVRTVKRIRLLIFLAFKTKVVVMRYIYYPDDFYCNQWLGGDIDFNEGSKDIIVLETVDPVNKNSLKFLNLKDIRVRGNYMYLVDEKLNMVLRYNIEFLRTQQGVTGWDVRSIRMLDVLQGEGTIRDDIYFNAPCSICADDNHIYVADRGNGCIKKYSEEFDYISTIRNGNFVDQDIQTIAINPYKFTLDDGTELEPNSLWIFATTGTSMYVHILNGKNVAYSHRIDKLEMLKDKYMWDEEFKSVKFSFTNSNYYYLATTKRVYKLHLSKPFYPFASLSYFKQRMMLTTMVWSRVPYPWHILPCGEDESGMDVTWSYRPAATSAEILDNKAFCLCGVDDYTMIDKNSNRAQFNGDIIFHIGTLYNQSKVDTFCKRNNCTFYDIPQQELADMISCSGMFIYNETTSWLSTLTKLDFTSYITEDIEDIDPNEYVNHITFNKIMYKVIYNLIAIKNHLIGRFWGAYNIDGLMCFDQLEYDDYFQNLRIENIDDLFVHSNEPMSIMVNRIFEKVYDLQTKILNRMAAQYRAISSFTNNSFRII